MCVPTGGTAGQLLDFPLPLTNPGTDIYTQNTPVDPLHCVGCVLTMLDGPAAGLSTRIVGLIRVESADRHVQRADRGL